MTAALIYTASWIYLLLGITHKLTIKRRILFPALALAIGLQGFNVLDNMMTETGVSFAIFHVATLFFVVINSIVWLSALKKPLFNLFLILIPATLATQLSGQYFGSDATVIEHMSPGILSHIILSTFAYSLLTIASIQALLLAYQYKKLKTRHPRGLIGILPPLQTMETLMFELVWAGFILLTLSIVSGLLFIDDIFLQHLSHKTAFSLLSWIIYATLLWGHWRSGWRGIAGIRWVLVGFAALMLAYFGSKLVLEVILATG